MPYYNNTRRRVDLVVLKKSYEKPTPKPALRPLMKEDRVRRQVSPGRTHSIPCGGLLEHDLRDAELGAELEEVHARPDQRDGPDSGMDVRPWRLRSCRCTSLKWFVEYGLSPILSAIIPKKRTYKACQVVGRNTRSKYRIQRPFSSEKVNVFKPGSGAVFRRSEPNR